MKIMICTKCGKDVMTDKLVGMHGKVTKVFNIEGKHSEDEFIVCKDCIAEVMDFIDPNHVKH